MHLHMEDHLVLVWLHLSSTPPRVYIYTNDIAPPVQVFINLLTYGRYFYPRLQFVPAVHFLLATRTCRKDTLESARPCQTFSTLINAYCPAAITIYFLLPLPLPPNQQCTLSRPTRLMVAFPHVPQLLGLFT